jgi:hypothetical protein
MRRGMARMVVAGVAAAALAGSAWGQRGGSGNGVRDGGGPLVDASRPVTVQGDVVRFLAGVGQGMPELVVRDAAGVETSFVLGPYWYLQQQGFAAQPGDRAVVNGFACASCEHGIAVTSVVNLTRSLTLTLRNADGTPLWIGSNGGAVRKHLGTGAMGGRANAAGTGSGRGPGARGLRCGGALPDLARTTTFAGAVSSFTGGAGEQYPTLVVAAAQGETSIMLAPYRVLLQAGYTPAPGAQVAVVAAPVDVAGSEEWVAITLTDVASGLVLQFRNPETGYPVVAGHGPWH